MLSIVDNFKYNSHSPFEKTTDTFGYSYASRIVVLLSFEIDDEEMWRVGHKTYNLSLLQSVKGKEAKFMANSQLKLIIEVYV